MSAHLYQEAFPSRKALLIVDLQNDFCSTGKLAVPGGEDVIQGINQLMPQFSDFGGLVVASRDTHPSNHGSFASQYPGRKAFELGELKGIPQVLWPEHCVIGTTGAEFHADFESYRAHAIISKGFRQDCDSYSAFWENDKQTATGLDALLASHNIQEVYVCGLATNFCVLYTSMDAAALGYKTFVIWELSRGLESEPGALQAAREKMQEAGITIIDAAACHSLSYG